MIHCICILFAAVSTGYNYGAIKELVNHAQEALSKGYYYDHIGSLKLWSRHKEIVNQLSQTLSKNELKGVSEN